MMAYGRTAATLAVLFLVSVEAAAGEGEFRARGNEPGWSLQKSDQGISFQTMDGSTVTLSPPPAAQKGDGVATYESTIGTGFFSLTIADKTCTDSMSGMHFPAAVTVQLGSTTYMGCGGEPASLLQGEWAVTQISGSPVVSESHPTINFDAGGQLSGNGSCNRYFGTYVLTGEGLTIAMGGSSMMMCPDPLMDQEGLLLKFLGTVVRFTVEPDGALVLHAADGASVTARRQASAQ